MNPHFRSSDMSSDRGPTIPYLRCLEYLQFCVSMPWPRLLPASEMFEVGFNENISDAVIRDDDIIITPELGMGSI